MTHSLTARVVATAAMLVVEEGMAYELAKRKAARAISKHVVHPAELPSNQDLEDEICTYISLYHADTQPFELAALRSLAADWMERLTEFRPHLTGAVWRGTATRLNNVELELFCDDSKSAEIALISHSIDFRVGRRRGLRGLDVDALLVSSACPALGEPVMLVLSVLDRDDLRGALQHDARGRTERGDLSAVRKLMGHA